VWGALPRSSFVSGSRDLQEGACDETALRRGGGGPWDRRCLSHQPYMPQPIARALVAVRRVRRSVPAHGARRRGKEPRKVRRRDGVVQRVGRGREVVATAARWRSCAPRARRGPPQDA
jgi:hypothetical protein